MATQQETKAAAFVNEWQGHGNERSETQKFWLQLLGDVLDKDNKAHTENDIAVLKLYGFPGDAGESDIVSRLMELYRDKVKPCR